ncbi:MAG: hypothetical protein ACLP36_08580 [Acidimicrobiales bacterium]|jgi:hypothetical protein
MRKSQIGSLCALLALGAIAVSLLASCTTTPVVPSSHGVRPIETQLAVLKGSDTVASDEFGVSVAVSGTTAVVGTTGTAYAGRAYVFTKTASRWQQTAELDGSDTVPQDGFGSSVAASGTTLIVGAYEHAENAGRAYLFTKTALGWTQVAELEGSNIVADDDFGWSVAISGTTALVGAIGNAKYAGRAYVFAKTATGWTEVAELKGSDTVSKDAFGTSVAISGTTVIVGAEGHAHGTGAAYVFAKTTTGWSQVAELKGSDTVAGDDFGTSVAISGTTAVVGAYGHAGNAGRAYVFTETASGWKQAAELKGSDTTARDYFGISVAISGRTAVVGAYDHDNNAGRAYLFTKTPSGWQEKAELKGSNTVAENLFGVSASISGTTAVVGAEGGANFVGRAYVFKA